MALGTCNLDLGQRIIGWPGLEPLFRAGPRCLPDVSTIKAEKTTLRLDFLNMSCYTFL